MTTTFFLLRHATHDAAPGCLPARMPGVRLSEVGRRQAERLGERLRGEDIVAVYTSPRERATETAASVAKACGLEGVVEDPALDEVDFGEAWQGKDFALLERDPAWERWNALRSLARTPGGERMIDVQARAAGLLDRLEVQHPASRVVLVSHAEVIRAVVILLLGMPIDAWNRLDVAPGSVTVIAAGKWGTRIIGLNEVAR